MEHDVRSGIFRSRSDFEDTLNVRTYFWTVVKAYLEVLETPALAAISHDPDSPNRKLGPKMIEFKVDVDNAASAALGGNPSLIDDWNRLIRGEAPPNANEIVRKVGKLLQLRHLIPHQYFTTIKKGRAGRRQNAQPGKPA